MDYYAYKVAAWMIPKVFKARRYVVKAGNTMSELIEIYALVLYLKDVPAADKSTT